MVNPGFAFEGLVAIPGGDCAQIFVLRKPVSVKGIWLSIDRSSYYGEVNIFGFCPFNAGYPPYLIGLCRYLQSPEIHQRHISLPTRQLAFCTGSLWNFRLQPGFTVLELIREDSAYNRKYVPK
jgi:hypothetical protein